MIKIDDLKNVKGIGPKAIERVRGYLEELKGDEAYVSEYDPSIHISPGDLVQGDMLEVMNGIPDESVDMILTDLPYGTTQSSWDSVINLDKMWKQYGRVIKPSGAIVLTASQPFTSRLVMSNPEWFKHEWIWEKNAGSNFGAVRYQPMKEHESVLVFGKDKILYKPIKEERAQSGRDRIKHIVNYSTKTEVYANYGEMSSMRDELRFPRSIQKFNRERGCHPNQKPVALLEYLIKTYTNNNEIILDSTMGSGSTGVAAMNTNRKFIGIEQDRDYFKTAENRVGEARESNRMKYDIGDAVVLKNSPKNSGSKYKKGEPEVDVIISRMKPDGKHLYRVNKRDYHITVDTIDHDASLDVSHHEVEDAENV